MVVEGADDADDFVALVEVLGDVLTEERAVVVGVEILDGGQGAREAIGLVPETGDTDSEIGHRETPVGRAIFVRSGVMGNALTHSNGVRRVGDGARTLRGWALSWAGDW